MNLMKKGKITVLMLCCLMVTHSLNIYKAKTEGKNVVTKVFEGSIFDGFIVRTGPNYTDVWSSVNGNAVVDQIETIVVGQHKSGDNYTVYRGFVIFDTTEIPYTANITAAVLSLCVAGRSSQVDFNITIQKSAVMETVEIGKYRLELPVYPHIPLILEDYNQNQYVDNGGSRSVYDGFNLNDYWNITLKADDLNTWVSKAFWSRLCLRSSRDIACTQPEQDEYIVFFSSEHIPPKLYVTYEINEQVGGITLFTDKLGLLAPYISAAAISCTITATIAHFKRAKRKNTS